MYDFDSLMITILLNMLIPGSICYCYSYYYYEIYKEKQI